MRRTTNDERRTSQDRTGWEDTSALLCEFLANPTQPECREFGDSFRELLESDAEGAAWLRAAHRVTESRPKSPLLAWWFCSETRFVPLAAAAVAGLYLACLFSPNVSIRPSRENATMTRIASVTAPPSDMNGYR